ncbi:MAG: sigma 54-interacting transcriptional regulator, partial [Pseudomonadota bacterium]
SARSLKERLDQARIIAGNESHVLIRGPSGAGKELFARAMHRVSPQKDAPFVSVGCSAIDEELLAAELFGRADTPGHFQQADGGILLLNEIADLPMALQVRLRRVLEEGAVHPLGGADTVSVNVRVFSTTNQDLSARILDGRFRDDLYYRLIEATLDVPALSEHREDIPVLAGHFLEEALAKTGAQKMVYAPEAIELLMAAPWPGNVRQLANTVRQHVSVCQAPVISASLVQDSLGESSEQLMSFAEARDEFIRSYLAQLLTMTGGNVSKAARMARRNRTDFYKLLSRHNLDPDVFKHARS